MFFDDGKALVALGVVCRVGDFEACEAELLEPIKVVASGVQGDLVADGSAKEFVDGSAEEFALEVPECDVDSGESGGDDSGEAVAVSGADYEVVHQLDGHAVLALKDRCDDMVDVGCDGLSERASSESEGSVFCDGLHPDFREAAGAGHVLREAGVLGVEVDGHRTRRFGGPWGATCGCFGLRCGNVDVDGA